jgi:hypothetical protein
MKSLYELFTSTTFNDDDKASLLESINYQNQYEKNHTLYAKLLKYAAEAFWPTGQEFNLSEQKIQWLIEKFNDECQNNSDYEAFKKDNFTYLTYVWTDIANIHSVEICEIFYKYVMLDESKAWKIAETALQLSSSSEAEDSIDQYNEFECDPEKIHIFNWIMKKAALQNLSPEFFMNVAHQIVKTNMQNEAFPIFFQSFYHVANQTSDFEKNFNQIVTSHAHLSKVFLHDLKGFQNFKIQWEIAQSYNQYHVLSEAIKDPQKLGKQFKI